MVVMDLNIKRIEDFSLNAWPSHQMQVYDGWILRYSYFYTHRTNCVDQIGLSLLPLPEKIDYCEAVYRRWSTPCIFKIPPTGDPGLDPLLDARGYRIEHRTTVMTRRLDALAPAPPAEFPLRLREYVDREWLDALFALKQTSNADHLRVVPQMYAAIPKDEAAAVVTDGGRVIATGLSIYDRDAMGIYAIHVDERYRRRGIATQIVHALLSDGLSRGAKSAYLQVVSDNAPAKAVYRRLGFSDSYRYYFRLKEV